MPKTFGDIPTISMDEAMAMAKAADFVAPVLCSGQGGIALPTKVALSKVPGVKSKVLYVAGAETPKEGSATAVMAKELAAALRGAGGAGAPKVVVPIEPANVEFYRDRPVADAVVEGCVLLPLPEPTAAELKTVMEAQGMRAGEGERHVFWAHPLASFKLMKDRPAFVVEAGTAFRGGRLLKHLLRNGAATAVSLAVKKHDGRESVTHAQFSDFAKPVSETAAFKVGEALALGTSAPPRSRRPSARKAAAPFAALPRSASKAVSKAPSKAKSGSKPAPSGSARKSTVSKAPSAATAAPKRAAKAKAAAKPASKAASKAAAKPKAAAKKATAAV